MFTTVDHEVQIGDPSDVWKKAFVKKRVVRRLVAILPV